MHNKYIYVYANDLQSSTIADAFYCSVQCQYWFSSAVCFAALVVFDVSLVYFSHLKNLCQNCVVYCVCNVLCLCLTSLTCNSMSRRRKEKDSFMRFVIVSILSFTWLFPLQIQRPLHFLLVLICLFGSGRPWNISWAATVLYFTNQHEHLGEWGLETVPQGKVKQLSLSHHLLCKSIPRAARMRGYFCL